jgi:hypothetical protein
MKCQHCGSLTNITHHHVHPLAHFGSKRTNQYTVPFCEKCHQILEVGILFLEARLGGVKYGTRFKLHVTEYENIVRMFSKKIHL